MFLSFDEKRASGNGVPSVPFLLVAFVLVNKRHHDLRLVWFGIDLIIHTYSILFFCLES